MRSPSHPHRSEKPRLDCSAWLDMRRKYRTHRCPTESAPAWAEGCMRRECIVIYSRSVALRICPQLPSLWLRSHRLLSRHHYESRPENSHRFVPRTLVDLWWIPHVLRCCSLLRQELESKKFVWIFKQRQKIKWISPISNDLLITSDVLYRSMQPSKNVFVRWTALCRRFLEQFSLVSPSHNVWNMSGLINSIMSIYCCGERATLPDFDIIATSTWEWNHWYAIPVSRSVAKLMWSSRPANVANPFLNARKDSLMWTVVSTENSSAFWSLFM